MSHLVVGLDAGGTKTAAVLASLDGQVLARTSSGPGNYQAVGLDVAREAYERALAPLQRVADERGDQIAAVAYGLSGVDRPRDEERLRPMLMEITPDQAAWDVVNDTYLILRAGTDDGVGIAVVSGTGSNAVGTGADGRHARIGGLGADFGDDGSADDIGRGALRAAFRAEDGRGEPTALRDLIVDWCGLERLDDLVDRFIADTEQPLTLGMLAPLVFRAARAGDEVALATLRAAGEALGHSARVVGRKLFEPGDAMPLVMGGSVLQRGRVDTMRQALMSHVTAWFPHVVPTLLEAPPLLGAPLLALDLMNADAGPAVRRRLAQGLLATEDTA